MCPNIKKRHLFQTKIKSQVNYVAHLSKHRPPISRLLRLPKTKSAMSAVKHRKYCLKHASKIKPGITHSERNAANDDVKVTTGDVCQ